MGKKIKSWMRPTEAASEKHQESKKLISWNKKFQLFDLRFKCPVHPWRLLQFGLAKQVCLPECRHCTLGICWPMFHQQSNHVKFNRVKVQQKQLVSVNFSILTHLHNWFLKKLTNSYLYAEMVESVSARVDALGILVKHLLQANIAGFEVLDKNGLEN